ncbi:hypothetical protein M501DRAFT_765085 [Patellaria atrata CBS 101060]|uniref:Uncharacterized protein n=1 Tax=Patellaria atrata CBS 101060 TaxID=1346257 RepID=A0A9P4SAQ5_9PEZI|nr:hypothetical protein M501DRAFT_765085 [Patellaria atrata CBS 101060]
MPTYSVEGSSEAAGAGTGTIDPTMSRHETRADNSSHQRSDSDWQPTLPPVSRMSTFGDDFWKSGHSREQSVDTTTTPVPDSAPKDAAGLQHQPSLGFKSVVHQAFDRKDDSSVPPTPVSRLASGDEGGVSRSNTNSTTGISPIISRVPSTAVRARDNATPAIEEEPVDPTISRSRPNSGFYPPGVQVARKPSPNHSRNVSSESANFTPGYRRDLNTPSPNNSPARSPAIGTSLEFPVPVRGELSNTGHIDSIKKNLPSNPQAYATREADLAHDINASPEHGPKLFIDTVKQSQIGFLETHKSPPLDICPTQAPSNAIPRAESPSKGRVADLAGKFNQIDSRRNSTNSVGSRHSIDSWERESVNELPSRKGSPSKQLAPAFEPTAQQAERPTSAREQSFRPKLPGQWESFATTVDSPTPTEQEHGQGLFLNENVSPSIAPPIAQQAATPVEVSNHVNEDLDIAPTTTKHPAAAPEETKEKSPSFTENPMAALAAAGAAMGDAIKASVGFDHSDEDRGSQSEVNRTVTDVPETSKDGQAKGRFVGDIYIRPLTLDRTASSVASSSPPTPPPKDESNKTISNIHSEESKLPSGLTSKDSHEPMMFNTSPSLGRPPILSQLSTDYSPNDEESDRLRKELVRTLSPIKSENDGKHNAGPALAHLTVENTSQPVNRESSILPAEYDTYWAGKFDDSEDDSTTPVKRSLETTRAPPAIQVPSSIATDTHQLSNQRPEVPHEQPSSAASVSEISRSEARFSWETGTEQLNQPSIASTLGSPAPVSSTYDQVASATAESPAHSESPADRSFDEKLPAPSDEHPAMRDTSVLATHPQTEAEIISHVPPPVSKVPDDQRASREGLHVVNAEPGEVPDPEPPAQVFQSGHSEDANPAVDNHKSLPSHHSRVVPLGFREILALKSTAERITTYNKTREQFAGMDTGIHHWINSTIANQPEHAYLASLPLRPTVTTTGLTGTGKHKSSPSISRFNKHSPGSGQASGSHGQQPFDSTTSSPAVNHPPQSQYSTPSPSGNKLSGHQMQAKLLKNASVLGGKATTGAKGLFAKGKSRFRSSGSEKDFLPQRHHSISSFDIAHNRSPSVTDKKKKRLSSPFSRRSQSRPTSIVLPITTDFSDFERNTPMSEGAVGRHRTSYIDTGRVESWNLPEPPPIPDTDDIDRLGVLPSPATEHFKQEFNVSAEQRLNAVEKEERILQSVVRNSTPNMSRSQTPDLNQGQSKHERRISVGTVGTGSELNWPLGDVSAKELREVRRSVDIPVPPLPQVEVKLKSFDADDSITDSPGDDVLPHSQVHGDVARSDSPKTVLSGEEESTDLQARPRLQSRNPLTRSGTHAVSSLRLDNSAVQSQPSKSLVRSATLGTVSSIESPELGRSYTHKTVSEMALSDGIPPVSEVSATATTPKLAALSQPPSRVSTPDSWEGKREQTLTEENLKELLEGRHPIRHPSLSSLGAEDRPDYHTETGNNLRIPGAFLETPAGELEESFHDDLHPVASESAEISTAEVQTVKYTLATPTSITLESPSNRTGLKTSPINQEPASVDNQSPPHEQPTASTPERVTLRRYNTNDLYGETPVVSPVRNSFLEREKEVETNGPNIEPRPATPDRPMSFVMLPRDGGVPQDRINRDSDSSDDDDDDDDDFEKIEHAKQFEATSQQLSPEPNQTQGDSYNHQRGVSGVTEHPGRASFGKAQWTGFAHPSKEMSDTSTIRPDRRFSGGKPHFPHIHDPTLVPRTRPPIPETGTASIEMKSVSQQDGGRMMSPQVIDPRKSSPEYQLPGIGPPSAPSVDTAQQQRPPSLLQTISNRATSTSSSAPAPPKNDRINPELTSSAHLDVGYPSVSTLEDHAMEKKKRKSSFFSAFNQPPVSSGESQRSKESTSVQPPQTSASNISDMLTDLPEAKGKSIFPFGSPTRLSTEVPEGKKKKRSSIFSGIFGRTSASTYALKPSKLLKSEPKKEEKQQKQQKPVAVPRPSGSYQQVFPQPPRLSFGSQPPNQQQGFQQRHSPGPSAPSQQHVHEQTTQPDFRPKVTQEGDQNRILTGPPGSAYETTRQQYQLQCTPTTQGEGRRSVSMPISPPANATSSPSRSEAYPPLGGYYAPPNFQTAQGYPDEKMILKAIAAQEQSSKQTARQQQETAMTRRRSSPAGSSEWQSRHNSMGLGGTTIPEERNAPSEEDQRFRPEQIQRAYTDAPNGYNYSQSSDRHIPPSNPQSTQVSAQQALEPSRTTESQPSDPRNQVSAQSMTSEARGPVPQWRIEEEPEQSIMKVNPRTSEKIEKGIQDDNSHSSNVHRCQSSEQIHLPLSVRHESTDSSFGERIISQISMQSLGESQSGAPDQSGSRSSSTSTMVSPISSRGSIPHLQSLVGGKLQGQRMGSISEGGAASTRNQSEFLSTPIATTSTSNGAEKITKSTILYTTIIFGSAIGSAASFSNKSSDKFTSSGGDYTAFSFISTGYYSTNFSTKSSCTSQGYGIKSFPITATPGISKRYRYIGGRANQSRTRTCSCQVGIC